MAFHLLQTIATAVLLTVPFAGAQTSPIVDLGYAQYQGAVNTANNISHFLGIRYAAAPLGDLRFRAPQPPVNMTGIQPATAEPNECFQALTGQSATNPLETRASEIVQTDDCLFLNVYYPSNGAGAPSAGLPTVVWIHGGGYIAGAASSSNGEDIIAQSNRGVVVVLIQYRLGFLPGAAVKENGALNAGLLDQDFAMRWISKFGGDPSKVTIWGQSAGAGSVLQHVVANGGRTEPQLFRGAITSSTFLPSQYQFNDPIPELLFSEVVARQRHGLRQSGCQCNGAQYSLNLFPHFGTAQANTVGALYANLGTELFQVDAVQGESIFICPTYDLLHAFPGRSFKGEFAIPPGLHANDFIDAFAQSFTSFIINLDPNDKVDPTTITPHWNTFDTSNTEMLFNMTAGVPVVHPITTSDALLERCTFWDSVGNLTAQ
ncbi:Alpha/Beta hydrolase protein [Mycena galopus ATCC 62051]|nr:Alpha/Beta hydrolase protein [Mycena galopus ATCC 62051]